MAIEKENAGKIYKKIGDILKEIDPVSKERKNSQQGYNFRGIEDAMNMFSPLLAKHGVFPVTKHIEDVRNDEVTSKTGTAGYHYVRRYTFAFYAEDGSYVETTADGEAIDYGDKASNKAYSTAYREAFWKVFIVPFEADDIENHDHQLEPPVKRAAAKKVAVPDANNPVFAKERKSLEEAHTLEDLGLAWSKLNGPAKIALTSVKDEIKAIITNEGKDIE